MARVLGRLFEDSAVQYVSKYAAKSCDDSDDGWFKNKKKYRISKGLKKAQEATKSKEVSLIKEVCEDLGDLVWEKYVDNSDSDMEHKLSMRIKIYELPTREVFDVIERLKKEYAQKILDKKFDIEEMLDEEVNLERELEVIQDQYAGHLCQEFNKIRKMYEVDRVA